MHLAKATAATVGGPHMKKLISTLVCLVALSMAALPVTAQTRNRCANQRNVQSTRYRTRSDIGYDNRNSSRVYREDTYPNQDYRYGQNRSIWDEHRDKITSAGGAVAGAVVGGLIGGKKGALIGAITGGAVAAIYTYKIRDKNCRY
jgi:outer membrane lipoprotein SlyB